MHQVVTAKSGTPFDKNFFRDTVSNLTSALVDRAVVLTGSGRVAIDFPRMTGTAVTSTDLRIGDLLHSSVNLLAELTAGQKEALAAFVDLGRSAAADNQDQTLFDELIEGDE